LFTNVINRATINCARVVGFDEKSCGSVIHEVSKVLLPPTQNILDLIHSESKYSTLSSIIKDTEVEKILQENNRSITFLAPTDETFAAVDEADLKTLKEDKDKATTVLKNHILTGNQSRMFCSEALNCRCRGVVLLWSGTSVLGFQQFGTDNVATTSSSRKDWKSPNSDW
jgi:uncharacterized surface protein with fasciclin (FAS1) repeats